MATNQELTNLLYKRFARVPNVTTDDCAIWVDASVMYEGYATAADIPQERIGLVMILAQAEGATDIAMSTAHFFTYTDGDEQVDKSKIAAEYRLQAAALREKYDEERKRLDAPKRSARFKSMKRLDRDK